MQPLLVTAAVILRDQRVLITRRPDHSRHAGKWEFPGGKIDPGESPQSALEREIREELDVRIKVGHIFDVVYHRYDWGPVLILAYRCTLIDDTLKNIGVAEHRWVALSELDRYPLLDADTPLVKRLQSP